MIYRSMVRQLFRFSTQDTKVPPTPSTEPKSLLEDEKKS
jgi:hypothetical protein